MPKAPPGRTARTTQRPAFQRGLLSDHIAAAITDQVIADNLQAGDRLPTEPELAARYDVSRTVIREAGRLLVERGLVDIRPGRGMVVADFDGATIARQYELILKLKQGSFLQLMELRLALEVEMTALAAQRRTEPDQQAIAAALRSFAGESVGHEAALRADLDFHRAVASAAHNPFFSYVINPINSYLRTVYRQSLGYEAARRQTLSEHTAMADAIAAGDPRSARDHAHAHLTRILGTADALTARRVPTRSGRRDASSRARPSATAERDRTR